VTTSATTGSESESDASVRIRDSQPAASGSSHQPRDPSGDSTGLASRQPAQQPVKSMPLWREARWGSDRVNARARDPNTGRTEDSSSSASGASSTNGAAAERLPWRRPSSGEGGRNPRPATQQRDPFVRRAGQNGASPQQASWDPGSSSRRGINPSRPDGMLDNVVTRRSWAERPRQKPALGELAAADRASNGSRASSSGSDSGRDSPRQQQQQPPEARQRRQHGGEDRGGAAPEQRRPARRNPGIPWEAKIVGHKGVPLLFVLPEDEQQGASGQGLEGPIAGFGQTTHTVARHLSE